MCEKRLIDQTKVFTVPFIREAKCRYSRVRLSKDKQASIFVVCNADSYPHLRVTCSKKLSDL